MYYKKITSLCKLVICFQNNKSKQLEQVILSCNTKALHTYSHTKAYNTWRLNVFNTLRIDRHIFKNFRRNAFESMASELNKIVLFYTPKHTLTKEQQFYCHSSSLCHRIKQDNINTQTPSKKPPVTSLHV